MKFLYPLIPILLQFFGAELVAKDKNDEGADDEIGRIMINIAPVTTEMVAGHAPKQVSLDALFVSLYNQAMRYLVKRKLLAEGGPVPASLPPA